MVQQPLILVVDDEPSIRNLLIGILEEAGYRTSAATNGREALDHYVSQKPDLILLDLMMPVMDGASFFRTIAERPDGMPPTIVLSANRYAGRQAEALGAQAFIPKPFDIHQLLSTIEHYLSML